jgi:S-methylmethionine-dependent homocysteine/selenocysteine methylase
MRVHLELIVSTPHGPAVLELAGEDSKPGWISMTLHNSTVTVSSAELTTAIQTLNSGIHGREIAANVTRLSARTVAGRF